jgi:hypothetical protein
VIGQVNDQVALSAVLLVGDTSSRVCRLVVDRLARSRCIVHFLFVLDGMHETRFHDVIVH